MMNLGKERGLWELYASDPEKQDVEAWGRLPDKISHRGFLKNSRYAPGRVQTRMTRKRWDETITWMQKKQGLGEWTPAIRNQIPDYREAVQGLVMPAEESQPRTRRMHEYDYPPNPL